MLGSVPLWARIALLLLLLALVALIDRLRRGPAATKWKEYGFVAVAGLAGALVGFLNDLITSTISPEYFTLGKGLEPGSGLTLRAGVLGLQAGLSAGAISGAVCLYAAVRTCRFPPLTFWELLRFLWRPIALAAATAILMALFLHRFDPLGFSADLTGAVSAEETGRFLTVWWSHCGLYLGLLLGTVWILVDIVRQRRSRGTSGSSANIVRHRGA